MAKREFIEAKEIVYTTAPIAPILQGDNIHYEDIAFKAQIGRIHTFSEQEIVKPVLDKIRAEIIDMRSKQNCSCSDCLDIIDKYMTESEVEDEKA